jgi:serine/threonine-protein kinase
LGGVRDLSGINLHGYLLEDCLGSSSHTAVYRASAPGGAEWAVKLIDAELEPEASLWERIRREAGLLSNVEHPDILPIHDAGRSDALTFATSPFMRARTLQDLMAAASLDSELTWRIVTQIADALDRVHYRGLVFRVLKPANILVDDSNKVHLVEFGLASRRVGPLAMSTPTYQLGAPQYLAPEQVEGREPDWRSDIYAMAVLVFELLTRTSLYGPAPLSETLKATLLAPVPSAWSRRRDLPQGVDRVLGRAMAKSPRERHRSVWELLDELVNLPEDPPPRGPSAVLLPAVPASGPPPEVDPATVGPTAPAPDSAVAFLHRVGVPPLEGRQQMILNSYFATLMRYGKAVSELRWPEVLTAAGLENYFYDEPPDDEGRQAPVEAISRLAEAVEVVFGQSAPDFMRRWGRTTTDSWIRSTRRRSVRRLGSATQRVESTLDALTQSLDRIRGEHLHAWRQMDRSQFWLVHCDNLMVVGRRKAVKSCHFWTAAAESTLRWAGLANQWVVDEVECGTVTGTFDCVFSIRRV